MRHYSRALDEIYHLRIALAFELAINKKISCYSSMPKAVHVELDDQRQRVEQALRSGGSAIYGYLHAAESQTLLRRAGARTTLTRHEWEHGR